MVEECIEKSVFHNLWKLSEMLIFMSTLAVTHLCIICGWLAAVELRSCNRDLMAFFLRPSNITLYVCLTFCFGRLSFPSVELQDMGILYISQVKQEGLKPGSSHMETCFFSAHPRPGMRKTQHSWSLQDSLNSNSHSSSYSPCLNCILSLGL